MNNNRMMKPVFRGLIILLAVTVGCRDGHTGERQVIRERIAEVPGWTERRGNDCLQPFKELCSRIKMRPLPERNELLKELQSSLLTARLDERSYSGREQSIDVYWTLVSVLVESFIDDSELERQLWRYELLALERFNHEMSRSEAESIGGVYKPPFRSIFIPKSIYLSGLHASLFRAVRQSFESQSCRFAKYYYSLSDKDRLDWKQRIEKVAGREVVIQNPNGRYVAPTPYKPRYQRERRRLKDGRYETIDYIGNRVIRLKSTTNGCWQGSEKASRLR